MPNDLERFLRRVLAAVLVAAGGGFGLDAAADEVDQRLADARKAMDARDFDRVLTILEPVKNPDGTRPEMVEVIRKHAAREKENRRALDMARKAIGEGNCDLADRSLATARETVSFRDEWTKARAQVDQCKPTAASGRKGEEQALFEEGKTLIKRRQYKEALPVFLKCIEVAKNNAECHLALGSVYARLRDPEKGVVHYREFLRLAPDHDRALEVRKLLEDFEDQRAKQK